MGNTVREAQGSPSPAALLLRLAAALLLAAAVILLAIRLLPSSKTLVLEIIAALAAAAVVTPAARLLLRESLQSRELARRAVQLQRFCAEIRKAAASLELETVLDASARVVAEVTGVRGCSISLLDAATGRMEVRAAVGVEGDVVADRGTYQASLLSGKPLVVKDTRVREFPEVDDAVESLICIPLRLEERIYGAICVYGERGQRMSTEMISTLSSLGDVVTLAIAHAFLYDDLRNLAETKTRFLLQASHELRSPANAIQSIAQTLLEGYLGELGERQREMIGRIRVRARILSDITSDLLTLAKGRVERATFVPAPVDLQQLVQESVKLFEERARAAGLHLEASEGMSDAVVSASEDAVRSVLTNLVANAITYTPAGGSVRLRIREDGEHVLLEVSDSGIGIPRDERDRLFTEFFRASNARTLAEIGTGLGLAIVKANVDRCGGTVEVESEEGRGTTFTVRLRRHGSA